mmetsp:Transcript_95294/g.221185  ORF Transcript_95294/g.221185 Transcript_95294/m.221185 type:complete len:310 (-) Transcript_95294:49-978(-)
MSVSTSLCVPFSKCRCICTVMPLTSILGLAPGAAGNFFSTYSMTTSRAALDSIDTTQQPMALCLRTRQCSPLTSMGCLPTASAPRARRRGGRAAWLLVISASTSCTVFTMEEACECAASSVPFLDPLPLPAGLPLPFSPLPLLPLCSFLALASSFPSPLPSPFPAPFTSPLALTALPPILGSALPPLASVLLALLSTAVSRPWSTLPAPLASALPVPLALPFPEPLMSLLPPPFGSPLPCKSRLDEAVLHSMLLEPSAVLVSCLAGSSDLFTGTHFMAPGRTRTARRDSGSTSWKVAEPPQGTALTTQW